MSKRYFILGLCMLFIQAFAQIVYAQNARTVTGVVVDEFGDPIIGAAIKIVDSTVGTISVILMVNLAFPSRKGEDWLFHL